MSGARRQPLRINRTMRDHALLEGFQRPPERLREAPEALMITLGGRALA